MKFSQVVGQEEIKDKLKKEITSRKIPHAQLFTGKEGTGKLAMALAFTQYLMCKNKTDDSCGKCASCIKNQLLSHPDVHYIFPNNTTANVKSNPHSELFLKEFRAAITQNPYLNLQDWYNELQLGNKQGIINQNDSVEIIKNHSLKPYEASQKVFVIWMAEKMNSSFANKILKVLEEPSEDSVFLLIAEDAEQLLPTIISRVQTVNFPPVSLKSISEFLVKKYGLSSQKAEEISVLSEGNVRRAVLLATDSFNNSLTEYFIQWMRLVYAFKFKDIIDLIDDLNKLNKEQVKELLQTGLNIFSQCIKVKYLPVESLHLTAEQKKFIEKFHVFVHEENIEKIFSLFNEAVIGVERNANVKILLLDLSIKMKFLMAKPEKVS